MRGSVPSNGGFRAKVLSKPISLDAGCGGAVPLKRLLSLFALFAASVLVSTMWYDALATRAADADLDWDGLDDTEEMD